MPEDSTKGMGARKRFVGTTCALLLAVCLQAFAQDEAARIVIAEDPVHMGMIRNDRISRGKVTVRNEGQKLLRLLQVRASCGCTAVVDYTRDIPPGGQGEITFSMDPRKIAGFDVRKSVIIRSSDPKTPIRRVSVEADIDPEFALEPDRVEFGELRAGEAAERTVILRQIQEGPMNLLRIGQTTGPDQITWSFEEIPEEEWQTPGKCEWRITVRVSPELKPAPFYAAARLMTNVKRLRRGLWLSARGKVIEEGPEAASQNAKEEPEP